MSKARFLSAARADLVAILTDVTETSGSIAVAQGFVARVRRQCHRLATLPGTLGRARPELRKDIRSFPYGSYVIFFRYCGDALEIVAVLHSSRDVAADIANRPERERQG